MAIDTNEQFNEQLVILLYSNINSIRFDIL